MRYPYQNYLKALICLGKAEIIEILSGLGFVPPSQEYLDAYVVSSEVTPMREGARLIQLPSANVDGHTDLIDRYEVIAEQAGILSMVKHLLGRGNQQEKQAHNDAFLMLGDAHIRDSVEALLLRKLPLKEIVGVISSTSTMLTTERAVEIFRYYFWDTENVDRVDWKAYLEMISDRRDRYWRIMSLYSRPDYLKWKSGAHVEMPLEGMLSDMASSLYFRFTEMVRSENPDNVLKAAKLAKVVTKVGMELNEIKSADQNNFAKELQCKLDFVEDNAPILPPENPNVK